MLSRRQILTAAALSPVFSQKMRAVPLADFKLGVTTDEIDEDLLTALRFLRSYDLKWAELRSVWGSYAEKQPLDKVKQMRALLDEYPTGGYITILESWRQLPDGQIEFTMRRLPAAD